MQTARLSRERVNERLRRAASFPVTVLAAPAGFGKSIALRDFLQTSRPDALRLDLRREDRTLLDLVRRLSETVAPVAPTAVAAFPALQERVMAASQPVRELSDWFAEHVKDTTATLVIDDLHHAAGDLASIAFLADVIERTSDHISWILAARTDVGLPIASWIAYGRMDFPVGEDDLRFTSDEAVAAAQDSHAEIEVREIEALRNFTDGWPVALNIALRTRTRAGDLPAATTGTRDLVYRYLAEQVFNSLSPLQRAFLLSSCVFSSFTFEIADQLGATVEFLEELRGSVTFLMYSSEGSYRYHDLFRDFLESELLRRGHLEWAHAVSRGAAILESRGDDAGALLLFVRARNSGAITRIVERSGITLFERGESQALRDALDAAGEENVSHHAMLTGIRAMLEASRGHFHVAEPAFRAAIDASPNQELRMRLVHRYAVELVRNGRDCVELLEPFAGDNTIPRNLQLPILGTLATSYASRDQLDKATATIERALAGVDGKTSAETRARLYQQAGYIYQFVNNERARTYAELAVDAAVARNLYDVAARACSVRFAILYNEQADPETLLAILNQLGEYARKGGSEQTRLFAVIASYDIQAERGNEDALNQLETELSESNAALPLASNELLLPARALRATWSGDFMSAFALLKDSPRQQRDRERAALAAAQVALYAAATGNDQEASAAALEARNGIDALPAAAMQIVRARLFLALAELLRSHSSAAHRLIVDAERSCASSMHQLKAFGKTLRVAHQLQLGQANAADWTQTLDRLAAIGAGGIARMIKALPLKPEVSGGYASLTPAERDILRLLATGASSKEVARQTSRSSQTVDTHIRSICRKLGCSGRREAIALATNRGWVQI